MQNILYPKKILRFLHYMTMLLSIFLLFGCQSTSSQKILSPPALKPESEIRLTPGDTIAIKFPYTTQLNDINETHTILPDGTITMALVGQVLAAGKTPAELQNELVKRHAGQLQNPVITVSVTSLFERKVYVGGEVIRPGLVTLPGQMSVMEAIFQAGGFNLDKAETGNVVLIRQQGNQRVAYALDFKQALQGDTHEPVYLQPQDIIYVPRTTIVNVDLWVKQHIYDLLPPVTFGYRLDSSD
ncbi:MAG: sugar transporter [Desulfobacteraceae bacterium]|nr:MAG: sugar transporter [Desulfobacteraceae bacterium]